MLKNKQNKTKKSSYIMKKTIVVVSLLMACHFVKAQDEGQMQLYTMQNKWEDAKADVDKALANPKLKDKDKPKSYTYKALVYGHLFADSAYAGKYPRCRRLCKICCSRIRNCFAR